MRLINLSRCKFLRKTYEQTRWSAIQTSCGRWDPSIGTQWVTATDRQSRKICYTVSWKHQYIYHHYRGTKSYTMPARLAQCSVTAQHIVTLPSCLHTSYAFLWHVHHTASPLITSLLGKFITQTKHMTFLLSAFLWALTSAAFKGPHILSILL